LVLVSPSSCSHPNPHHLTGSLRYGGAAALACELAWPRRASAAAICGLVRR
jgi:hypothetical protein